MATDLLNNHDVIFATIAFIFSFGGFWAVQKKLPELLKKSMDAVDAKIDKLDVRMDNSDKVSQSMQIAQAKTDEKMCSIQNGQNEMKRSMDKIMDFLNSNRGVHRGE